MTACIKMKKGKVFNTLESTLICLLVLLIFIIGLLMVINRSLNQDNTNSTKIIDLYKSEIEVMEIQIKNYKRIAEDANLRMRDMIEVNSSWKEEDFE